MGLVQRTMTTDGEEARGYFNFTEMERWLNQEETLASLSWKDIRWYQKRQSLFVNSTLFSDLLTS